MGKVSVKKSQTLLFEGQEEGERAGGGVEEERILCTLHAQGRPQGGAHSHDPKVIT